MLAPITATLTHILAMSSPYLKLFSKIALNILVFLQPSSNNCLYSFLASSILQSGIIDRENKSELKKLREAMERIEGEPSGIIDI